MRLRMVGRRQCLAFFPLETLSKIEASLCRVNDAVVMMLAKISGCKITALFPTHTKAVQALLRHSQ